MPRQEETGPMDLSEENVHDIRTTWGFHQKYPPAGSNPYGCRRNLASNQRKVLGGGELVYRRSMSCWD